MTVPGDACHPTWRASGMGVYRMWRDAGFGVGALGIGLTMGAVNLEAAFYITAVPMFLSVRDATMETLDVLSREVLPSF